MPAQLIKILLVEYHFEKASLFEEFLSESGRISFDLTHTQRLDQTLRLFEQESFDAILLDPLLPDSQGLETLADIRSKAPQIPIVVLIGFENEELAVDIVLMDCQIPVMDGYEATQLLRAFEGESCRTVVIAMTANALVGDGEKCLAADMDDYISKPVPVEQLEKVLERWVPQQLKEPELQIECEIALKSQNGDRLTSTDNCLSTSLKVSQCSNEHLDQVPVDLERLSELTMGDTEFQRELLQVFIEDAVVYLEELKSTLATGDCVTLSRRAHQLKGSSATVAIYKIAEIAAQIERQAEENQLLGISDRLTELEQVLGRLQGFIEEGL